MDAVPKSGRQGQDLAKAFNPDKGMFQAHRSLFLVQMPYDHRSSCLWHGTCNLGPPSIPGARSSVRCKGHGKENLNLKLPRSNGVLIEGIENSPSIAPMGL